MGPQVPPLPQIPLAEFGGRGGVGGSIFFLSLHPEGIDRYVENDTPPGILPPTPKVWHRGYLHTIIMLSINQFEMQKK